MFINGTISIQSTSIQHNLGQITKAVSKDAVTDIGVEISNNTTPTTSEQVLDQTSIDDLDLDTGLETV